MKVTLGAKLLFAILLLTSLLAMAYFEYVLVTRVQRPLPLVEKVYVKEVVTPTASPTAILKPSLQYRAMAPVTPVVTR